MEIVNVSKKNKYNVFSFINQLQVMKPLYRETQNVLLFLQEINFLISDLGYHSFQFFGNINSAITLSGYRS